MTMPNNSLINIAQVLAERVGEKSPTQLQDMVIDNELRSNSIMKSCFSC